MTTSIDDICRFYLTRDVSLAKLREWMALSQWDLSDYERHLADDIDAVLAHFDDNYIDEISLRMRIAEFLERRTVQHVNLDFILEESIQFASKERPSTTSTETLFVVAAMP